MTWGGVLESGAATDGVAVPVCDMGEYDTRFAGILCPTAEINAQRIGITQQFLADAEHYHERYSNTVHFHNLFAQAFAEADVEPAAGLRILDIGAGSGTNTVVPCLGLFPECRITATDLSPDLLRILRGFVCSEHLEARVQCVCTDAMNDIFEPCSFDVVVGAAILHHLLDPVRAMRAAHRALRPGGYAFFFEPFEGVAILRIAYDLIASHARSGAAIDPEAARLLEAMSVDYAARTGSDKSAPHFQEMDDKWVFTRDWLGRAARQAGFGAPIIVAHASHATLFRDYTASVMRLGAQLAADRLADWAWDIIDRFDQAFSPEMKRDVLLEGTIVLRKPI